MRGIIRLNRLMHFKTTLFNKNPSIIPEILEEIYFSGPIEANFSDAYENQTIIGFRDEDIDLLIKYCNDLGIKTNLLCNKASLYFTNHKKIIDFIKKKKQIDAITIADPYFVPIVNKEFPRMEIHASMYMGLDNSEKIRQALISGITTVTLPLNLNRNLKELKKISSLKEDYPFLKIKLLAISPCYLNCIYSNHHPFLPVFKTQIMTQKQDCFFGELINEFECHYKVKDKSDFIKKPYIRPEDLHFYEKEKVVDIFKLAYRNMPSPKLKQVIMAYINRSFDGNLFDIIPLDRRFSKVYCINKMIPSDFIEKVTTCDMNCDLCKYCITLAEKCIKVRI